MKPSAFPTPATPTTSDIKAAIHRNIDQIEMTRGPKATCSSDQYAAVLFFTLVDLGILPHTSLDAASVAWRDFPKSPSAFAQLLQKDSADGVSKAASSLISRYSPPPATAAE